MQTYVYPSAKSAKAPSTQFRAASRQAAAVRPGNILSRGPIDQPPVSVIQSFPRENTMTSNAPIEFASGFPPNNLVAPADHRYKNKYYWDVARDQWLLIVDCKQDHGINTWAVQAVDKFDGCPVGHVERFTTDLWANRFADRPFDLRMPYTLTERDWFTAIVQGCSATYAPRSMLAVPALYNTYLERRKLMSSYDALIRVGLRAPTAR